MSWPVGHKHSEESKLKVSLANKGKKCSVEAKRKISEANKGKTAWNKGKTGIYSKETLRKMSNNRKGKGCGGLPKEVVERIAKSNRGKKRTEEQRERISRGRKGKSAWNKGKTHSKKTKKKLSEINRGRRHSEETKLRMSMSRKQYLSEHPEVVEKMKQDCIDRKQWLKFKGKSTFVKGSKHSEESKLKMSLANSGENHPQWQGGIACEPYCDVWLDKEFKEDIKKRDNYECQNPDCYGMSKRLCIHHINYIKKDCRPDNLITLCVGCNTRANFNRDGWRAFYESGRN